MFDLSADIEVHTDAPSVDVSGILMKSMNENNVSAVQYYSQGTTKMESKYLGHELGVLAIVKIPARFNIYLIGRLPVIIIFNQINESL